MIWMKARERVTTLRSCIFFLQSPCKYPCFLQVVRIWPSLVNPPDKFQRPPRIPRLAGEISHHGEPSTHQQLFKSSMMLHFPVTTGREDKRPCSRDGVEPLHKLEEGPMELPVKNARSESDQVISREGFGSCLTDRDKVRPQLFCHHLCDLFRVLVVN